MEWREGSAAYYPLLLPQFRPWPPLADLVAGSAWLVTAVTWGTLMAGDCVFLRDATVNSWTARRRTR